MSTNGKIGLALAGIAVVGLLWYALSPKKPKKADLFSPSAIVLVQNAPSLVPA